MVNHRKNDLSRLAIYLIVIIIISFLSSSFHTRFDFTKEKRFTLSPITKRVLSNLNDDIYITVYLEGDLPGGFKRLREATKDLLSDYKTYSEGKLHFNFVNPSAGNEADQQKVLEELVSRGVEPANVSVKTESGQSQKMIFPAALITFKGRQMPVTLFQSKAFATPGEAEEILNNSVQNLEYAFSGAIKKVTGEGKPVIAFTDGNGELNDLQLYDAFKSLEDGYTVRRMDLNQVTFSGLDKVKLLVIPKPDKKFSEAEKYKIDYFVMRGGRILWAIDNVNAELDSLQGHGGQQMTFPKSLNLDDILFKYGVRINYNLIADMNCGQIPVNVGSIGGQSQIQLVPWLFYPIFIPTSSHPIVRNLGGIRSEFASTIDTIAVKGIKKQVILASSPYSQIMGSPSLISLKMIEREPDPRAFKGIQNTAGVVLEGSFPSNFNNRPVPEDVSERIVIPGRSKPTKMVVLSDGDILKNQISSKDNSPFPLGYDRYTQQSFANKSLLLNIVDYLTDDSGLIELRNKEVKLRLLDKARVRDERFFWQIINIVLPVFLIIVFGIFYSYYRVRKYAVRAA